MAAEHARGHCVESDNTGRFNIVEIPVILVDVDNQFDDSDHESNTSKKFGRIRGECFFRYKASGL